MAALLVAPACATLHGETGIRPFAFDLFDIPCPSGLHIIFERAPGAQQAGVVTVVGAGSVQDPAGREGLAHFVEHLLFREAHAPEAVAVNIRLQALGTSYNAFTRLDETVYHSFVPHQSLRDLLVIEGQRLAEPLAGIDQRTFDVEREVVRNERRERNETHTFSAGYEAALEAAFPADHPYHRSVIGSHESLSAITMDDARRFVSANYRPENMTMIVVGDLDPAAAQSFIKDALPPALWGDPANPRPHRAPPVVPATAPPLAAPHGIATVHASLPGPELWIAWPTPGGFGREAYAAEALDWLASSAASRGLLDDRDVASVDFIASSDVLAGAFLARVRLTEGKHPEESAKQVIEQLPWIGGDDLDFYFDRRIEHIKLALLRELAQRAESGEARGEVRALHAHLMGSAGAYGDEVATIRSLTGDDVARFAKTYLTKDRARAVLVAPYTDDAPPPSPEIAKALVDTEHHGPLPAAALGNLVSLRHLGAMKTVDLDNGLRVVLLPRPGAPVVTASLVLHGGEAAADLGVVRAAHEAVDMNWQDSPGDHGIVLSFSSDLDNTAAVIHAGADNLALGLDMLSFATRSQTIDWPKDKFREAKLPRWRLEDAFPTARASRGTWKAVYGAHPYGVRATGDDVAAVSKSAISTWLDRTLVPKNAALVIVGDIDVAQAEAEARSAFGGWSSSDGPVAPPPAATPVTPDPPGVLVGGSSVIVTPRPGASQTEVLLACALPPSNGPETAVYEVASKALRQRLHWRLREDAGATYGVDGGISTFRGGATSMWIRMNVENARLPLALETTRSFFRDVDADKLDPEVIKGDRDDLTRDVLMGWETSDGLADSIAWAWNLDWPLTWADDAAGYFAKVQPQQVTAALRVCGRNQTLALTGDEKVVRRALAKLAATSRAR
ncbi:MAG TPA: insulinase family protein [Polyangia bacterium]|nr:insulinase family protein [Polyangia bacterium]